MSGAVGAVLLAGVDPGVDSTFAVVEVASTLGLVVPLSISFSGVVTTTGVGRAGVSTSVSVPFSGGGVLAIVVGVLEVVVWIMIGVGAGVSISVSVSCSGAGVLIIVSGVSEMVVSIMIGVGAGVPISVAVSFLGGEVRIIAVGVVNGNVVIELVVMVNVCVIGTVFGVSLTVTTVLVTG